MQLLPCHNDEWLLDFLNIASALLSPAKGVFLCSIEYEGLKVEVFSASPLNIFLLPALLNKPSLVYLSFII